MENIEFIDQQNWIETCSNSFEDYGKSDYYLNLIDEQLEVTSPQLNIQLNLSDKSVDFNNNIESYFNNEYLPVKKQPSLQQIEAYQQQNFRQIKRKRILNNIQRAEATKRERRRMVKLNEAFEHLRQILPISELAKAKLSRAETLKYAVQYMKSMVGYLNNNEESTF